VVFLVTGSLAVPMMVHALLDLRVLLMLPEGFAEHKSC
jgi:membrane protease YdiL (CAAX protease family)